jgi:hypothetical protein
MYNVGRECVMAKVYLKKVDGNGVCQDCYFKGNRITCNRPEIVPKCKFKHIYKKITERETKKMLKSGWRISCLKI